MIYRLTIGTGLLLLLTAVAHFLNINETLIGIKTGDIAPAYASEAFGMWVFSGTGMALIGLWLLFLAGDLKRRLPKAWWQVLLISFSLAGFSLVSWWQYPRSLHFLYFLLIALMLLLPLLAGAHSYFKSGGTSPGDPVAPPK
jgi:hypothetical protein